jgi:hypothetical protein
LVNQDSRVRCREEDDVDRFAKARREGVIDLLESHKNKAWIRKYWLWLRIEGTKSGVS